MGEVNTVLLVVLVGFVVTFVLLGLVLGRLSARAGQAPEVRDELRLAREDARISAKELRQEIGGVLKDGIDTLSKSLGFMGAAQDTHMSEVNRQIKEVIELNQGALERTREVVDQRVKELQNSNEVKLDEIRKESAGGLKQASEALNQVLRAIGAAQESQLSILTQRMQQLVEVNEKALDNVRNTLDTKVKELQAGNEARLADLRTEMSNVVRQQNETLSATLERLNTVQQSELQAVSRELKEMVQSTQAGLEKIRETLDSRVLELQSSNEKRLDEMRRTVDEKLHETLERRLGESFKLVSDRLDAVHKGLGEMQSLANGVGDLKRVLTNVKTRGTWAEVQLGGILGQILTPEQYEKNVRVKPESAERVEYAIRLPGLSGEPDGCVWLPIDSKFPHEDYARLQDAAERADPEALQMAIDALLRAIRVAAKDIQDKYISPPHTTDFAILFLATEGLYAELARQPAFVEELQERYRIVVAGPNNLGAFLCSLRMGFQAILIQKHADDVWKVLSAVKTEFGKFDAVLDKVRRQLEAAARSIDETGQRTRVMERRLREVDALPGPEAAALLGLSAGDDATPDAAEEQPVGQLNE